MTMKRTAADGLLAAVDGSEQGYRAVALAALEAQRAGLALDLVHVTPGTVPTAGMMITTVPPEMFESYGAEILERARTRALATVADLEVRTHLRIGARIPQLLAAADHARLVVLGSRSAHSLDRIWTGGTVTGVASQAHCPVLVVPSDWEPAAPHRRIVVGYKSAEHSGELFDAAFPLADQLDAELVVIHAWRLQGVYDDIIANRVDAERWQREATGSVERQIAGRRQAYPDVRVRVYVRHEDAPRALVRASRGADRLLIGRPAHGGLVHHLGRTARAVLREARCPVEVLAPVRRGDQASRPLVVERVGDLVG